MSKNIDKNQYLERLKSIRLRKDKREIMRQNLSDYADFNTSEEGVRIPEQERLRWYTQPLVVFGNIKSLKNFPMIKAGIMIAIIATTGGATSFAAQNSVPGDTLYPVKIHVNENVRGVFSVSANARAEHNARLVTERANETEELMTRGALTEDKAVKLNARINARVEATERSSARADVEVRARVRTDIENRLESLRTRLETETNVAGTTLTSGIEQALRSTARIEGYVEAEADIKADTEVQQNAIEATEARLNEARAELESAADVSTEARAEIEARINTASNQAAEARAELQADVEANVRSKIEQATQIINEVESSLRTHTQGEVRSNTGVEIRNGQTENETSTQTDVELDTEVETRSQSGDDNRSGVGGSVDVNTDAEVRLDM